MRRVVLITVGLLLIVGAVELSGFTPPVQRAACKKIEAKIGGQVGSCTHVSIFRGFVDVEGLSIERAGVRVIARSGRLTTESAALDTISATTHIGGRELHVAGFDGTVTLDDGDVVIEAAGMPDVCIDWRCARIEHAAAQLTVSRGDELAVKLTNGRAQWGSFDVELAGSARHALDTSHLRLVATDARLGDVTVEMATEADDIRATIDTQVHSYAQLARAVAWDFDAVHRLGVDGPFTGSVQVVGPRSDPTAWDVTGGLDLEALRDSARIGPTAMEFREPFVFTPTVSEEAPRIVIDPDAPTYVRLEALPEHVVKSILYAEDAGFGRHTGIDVTELAVAIQENIEAGEAKRGASTITQQLAKNLWLSTEKSLQRKMREALAAIALEALLSKAQILEIYVNSIQWGPDFYGLVAASDHYFAKRPADLTPKEAAFLASVIPSPTRYHQYCQTGLLTERWEERVMAIVGLLHLREVITAEEHEHAAQTVLEFAPPTPPPLDHVTQTAYRQTFR